MNAHEPRDGRLQIPIERLLRPSEAAGLLAIGSRKLWELTNRHEITALRIGRSWRYDPADLRTWIEAQKRKSR